MAVAALLTLLAFPISCGSESSDSRDGTELTTPTSSAGIESGSSVSVAPAGGQDESSSGSAAIALAEAGVAAKDSGSTATSPGSSTDSTSEAGQSGRSTASATSQDAAPVSAQNGAPDPQPATESPEVVETLIQLIDPLDEPEFYCVDIPGFGNNLGVDRPLQAHTCKPGANDELFTANLPIAGRLYMAAHDLCMEAEGELVYTRPCSDSPNQQFVHGADGSLRTADREVCLTVAPGEGEPAGGPSHLRRDLRLVSCADATRNLSRWHVPGPNPGTERSSANRLMYDALDSALLGDPWDIEKMGETGDPAFIPVLVELMRFPWWLRDRSVELAIFDSLDRIAARNPSIEAVDSGREPDEWFRWVVWIGQHPEVWPPPGFAGWKGTLFSELVNVETGALLYEGMPANIRVEEIVWGGVGKDQIPDLTDAPVIAGADADYLDPEDRVFGVSFNGEHRAYPHRIVNAHEMANDVVGGVPFALAY